jgi:hypothetical protein
MSVVAVAQSVERQIVALEGAGSSPVGHPKTYNSALNAVIFSVQGIFIFFLQTTVWIGKGSPDLAAN